MDINQIDGDPATAIKECANNSGIDLVVIKNETQDLSSKEYSLQLDVDLIVMSTQNRSGTNRWFAESIAETVLKYGDKTVLIIKPGS